MQTDFQTEWNFRLEIEDAPADFDFYIKDISYSYFDIATDKEKCGAASYTWPTGEFFQRLNRINRDIHADNGTILNPSMPLVVFLPDIDSFLNRILFHIFKKFHNLLKGLG